MTLTYLAPSWFFGYDVVLELFFAIILLAVTLLSYKIYKITNQKQIKLFGIAFGILSFSYFLQSLFNYFIISKINETICKALKIQSISFFDAIGLQLHMFFMITGLVLLAYTTLKTKKIRTFWLLLLTSILGIFLSVNSIYIFYLFSTIYLTYLSGFYIRNYLIKKQTKTLLIALAFGFLLFGSIHFLISVNHQLFYAIGHGLELVAYLLILLNLYLVIKK